MHSGRLRQVPLQLYAAARTQNRRGIAKMSALLRLECSIDCVGFAKNCVGRGRGGGVWGVAGGGRREGGRGGGGGGGGLGVVGGGGRAPSRSHAVSAPADRDASQLYCSCFIISEGGRGRGKGAFWGFARRAGWGWGGGGGVGVGGRGRGRGAEGAGGRGGVQIWYAVYTMQLGSSRPTRALQVRSRFYESSQQRYANVATVT